VFTIEAQNVCQALDQGYELLRAYGYKEPSRAGEVQVLAEPVMTIIDKPWQRVLFSAVRDANPFFHMFEAIWMLAGAANAEPLETFVRDFNVYAEPDTGRVHGAYGARWRGTFGFDQLDYVIQLLRREPYSRQAVIQMWDCTVPLLFGSDDLRGDWKDRPCNTHIYLRLFGSNILDMTVCCRSNDALWGAHGANAVHFSVLHEYLAASLGVTMGTLQQLSNNYHAYTTFLDTIKTRMEKTSVDTLADDRYFNKGLKHTPMFEKPDLAYMDARLFVDAYSKHQPIDMAYGNAWFNTTLVPAITAHNFHKTHNHASALSAAKEILADDWRIAMIEWLERRAK
jgi:thymidylate synthase